MGDLHPIDDRSDDEIAIDARLTARLTELGDALPAPPPTVEAVAAAVERGRDRQRRDALVGRVAVVVAFLVLASGVTLAAWPRDRGNQVDTTPFATAPPGSTPVSWSRSRTSSTPGPHDPDP